MLGLSIQKLLLTLAMIYLAYRGIKLFNEAAAKIEAGRKAQARERAAAANRPPPPDRATELVECPRCGLYVPNGTYCRSLDDCAYRDRHAAKGAA